MCVHLAVQPTTVQNCDTLVAPLATDIKGATLPTVITGYSTAFCVDLAILERTRPKPQNLVGIHTTNYRWAHSGIVSLATYKVIDSILIFSSFARPIQNAVL